MSDNVLILAPHTDDGEFGCGGTIAKLLNDGKNIYYIAFSSCEDSLHSDLPKDTLVKELKAAAEILGIKSENVIICNFPVRKFPNYRQEILDLMVQLDKKLMPKVVFTPCSSDVHQDHTTIYSESLRAFKRATVLGYQLPWNLFNIKTEVFYSISEEEFNIKIEAIGSYKSQMHRSYASLDFLRSQLVYNGTLVGVKYAEIFEAIRIINR